MADVKKQVEEVELRQDVPTHDWAKFRSSCCCGCFNFVLQLVLVGSLGSFMFGFNMSLLNTATTAINSSYLQCGPAPREYEVFLNFNVDNCIANPVCAASCGVFGDLDHPETMTAVRCPGGYNDIGCASLKWYNAFLACSLLVGAFVGAMTGGNFLQFGRRTVLIITMLIFCVGIISSTTANSFSAIIWARLIVGYAVGLSSVASPTYMSEVTPANKRGTYGVFHQLFIVIGIFVAMLLGLPLVNPSEQDDLWVPSGFQEFWWRFMLGLGFLPCLFALYMLLKVYNFDTPVYYVENRRYQDAAALLEMIHQKKDVKEELNSIIDTIRQGEISKEHGMSFRTAFSDPEYRWVIIIGCLLSAFQQFGGINVYMTSSSDLFRKAGLDGQMQTVMSIVMGAINVVMTFPTLYLIEKMGRKSLMFIGSLCQFIAVVPAAIVYWTEADAENPSQVTKILAIVAVLGFVCSFAIAFGPVLWVYLFEIYPIEIKDVAAGVATTLNWVAGIIMVFVAIVLPNQISFTIFAILQLLATLLIFFFMKETKGRELGDSPFITKKMNPV